MEPLTTIKKVLKESTIYVPNYQRAYSWDSPCAGGNNAHVAVFLEDLIEHINSKTESPYYLGHFLFEKDGDNFKVIDGQQRLTTITILLAALFETLRKQREPMESDILLYEDTIKRGMHIYRFSTVEYDSQFFRDYVINGTRNDRDGLETTSARRIADAFDYYMEELAKFDLETLSLLLDAVLSANCTTHSIAQESEAIQMFIFQNSRGKKPTNLEIVKAQFMYHAHLHGGDNASDIINEIKRRFETIYHSISVFEDRISEDEILLYTQRVHFNSLWEGNSLEKISKELDGKDPVDFIQSFTLSLESSFQKLKLFYGLHERELFDVHSLISLGGIGVALPFVIKAYRFGLSHEQISTLCCALESLVLRHRLVGTKAYLESRINEVYESFTAENTDITPILTRIDLMKKTTDWWWAYWNNDNLKNAIRGGLNHSIVRFLLWKYENHLRSAGKSGYNPLRYDSIESPELEHIAPQTEPSVNPHGYGEYDDEFRQQYLDCLGNYLLVSKSHNCSIGNQTFDVKLKDYNYLLQQSEIKSFLDESEIWDKTAIQKRKEEIIRFVLECC